VIARPGARRSRYIEPVAGLGRSASPPAQAHATAAASFVALAPLRLPLELCLTQEQFALVCAENRSPQCAARDVLAALRRSTGRLESVWQLRRLPIARSRKAST
jgi:hypothetical protein